MLIVSIILKYSFLNWSVRHGEKVIEREPFCVVIGAGMAGLSAAWRLERLGISTRVLEAESFVGGRTRSVTIEGCRINTGAAFFTSFYDETLAL
jgi:protoporphyrinogen/coproporphyrinogen III oxidase